MTIATVMVYVDPEQQAEGQVRVARNVADRFGASLIGVSAVAVEPPFVAEGVIIRETTADDLKRMKSALSDKEQWFRSVAGLQKDRVEWRCSVDFPTAFLTNEARSADLVVIRRRKKWISSISLIQPRRLCGWEGRRCWSLTTLRH